MIQYKVIDLSRSLEPGMPESPAVPRFSLWWYGQQTWGDAAEYQAMLISEHTGTNVDAPRHVFPDGKTIDELPADAFMGRAIVLDMRPIEPLSTIAAEDVEAAETRSGARVESGDIVLLLTGYDDLYWRPVRSAYVDLKRRPGMSLDAARYLVGKGVKAIGVDTTSPDLSGRPMDVHHYLLSEGVLIIEGLTNLDRIPPGHFLFVALPLKIHKGSGSPVRAVALLGLVD